MKRVRGLKLRDRIAYEDIIKIYELAELSQKELSGVPVKGFRLRHIKKIRLAIKYQVDILTVVTTNKKCLRRKLKYMKEILEHTRLVGDGKSTDDLKDAVLKLCAWIGALVNRLPHEVSQMTPEETKPYIYELLKKKIEQWHMSLMIAHLPKKANEKILDLQRRLPKYETKKIAQKKPGKKVNYYDIGRMASGSRKFG